MIFVFDLEDLMFYYQTDFNIPLLLKFVSRTLILKELVATHAVFERHVARVNLVSQTSGHEELSRLHSREPLH